MAVLHIIFVEGDTEVLFYKRAKAKWYHTKATKVDNLGGNFSCNQKILERSERFHEKYVQNGNFENLVISICMDTDSRVGKCPVDLNLIKNELAVLGIADVELFEAVQDIESWFFHDLEGILKFLRASKKTNKSRYNPVERLNHRDLSALFSANDKKYRKGQASQHFIDNLDLDVIRTRSGVFRAFITRSSRN